MKIGSESHCLVLSPIDCSEKSGPEFDFFCCCFHFFFFFPRCYHSLVIKMKMAYIKAELLTAVFHLFYREAIFTV